MKRIVAVIMALALLFACGLAIAQEAETDGLARIFRPTRVVDTIGLQSGTQIVVAGTTPPYGVFGTNLLTGSTSDIDIRMLLEGYATVATTRAQEMVFDGTAVNSVETQQEANGDRTYTIALMQGLTYNDGTPITAKDYVFSILLSNSPALSVLRLSQQGYDQVVGMEEYRAGEQHMLSGVSLVDEMTFMIRISKEFLPFFYGMQMLNITPYPYHVIAPGCDILDDGSGAYVGFAPDAAANDVAGLEYTPGVFDAAMLKVTLLDEQTGYAHNPRVTAGPYMLESYNPLTGEVALVVNEKYMGNYEGQKPHIERVILRLVTNENMMAAFRNGEVQLLNKVSNIKPVTEGLAIADREHLAARSVYPRSGLAFLSFACEQGPTQYESVRKAISRCIDRNELIAQVLGETNGIPVYAYYGIGQWMLNQTFSADPAKGREPLVVQDAIAPLAFGYDIEDAKAFLIEGGWTLNKDGNPFVEGVDDIRYLDIDGVSVPLEIKWAKMQESQAADILEGMLTAAFAELGIGLEITEMSFRDMLKFYYREVDRTYDMFFVATNFGNLFDPYLDFNIADEYQGQANTTGLRDEELMLLAKSMRETSSADPREYVERWIRFQHRLADLMPIAPLYSNVYFDFYPLNLRDYKIEQHNSWAPALCYAWFGDAPEQDYDAELTHLDEQGQPATEAAANP